jgi:hypothetical protein
METLQHRARVHVRGQIVPLAVKQTDTVAGNICQSVQIENLC